MLGVVYIETDRLTERGNDGTELKIPLDKCFHSLSDQTLPLSSQPLKNCCNHQSVFFPANWAGRSFIFTIMAQMILLPSTFPVLFY